MNENPFKKQFVFPNYALSVTKVTKTYAYSQLMVLSSPQFNGSVQGKIYRKPELSNEIQGRPLGFPINCA